MKKTMYDLVPSEYRECLKPLAEVLKASISFMWGGNGFVAKESRCFLSVGSDHELVLSISSVKSIHFVSRRFKRGMKNLPREYHCVYQKTPGSLQPLRGITI